MKRSRVLTIPGSGIAVGALLAAGGTAFASSGSSNDRSDDRSDRREIRKAGTCTGNSTAKIKVKDEDRNRLEMEFEVDQNRNGQRWGVVVKRNGRSILRRAYRTKAPSGSFEARRIIRNARGKDRFVAIARNRRTGERCTARVSF